MSYEAVLKRRGFGQTERRDNWWLQPLIVVLGFGGAMAYMTWAAFQGEYYTSGPYLSPLYSPEIYGSTSHAWIKGEPSWWPDFIKFSPAFLILMFPGGFRITCYYYRGSLYKAFWADPPNCAVGEPRKSFWGENSLPLILQNVHRYFLYFALLFIVFLSYDAYLGYWFDDGAGGKTFGIGVGSLVLTANAILLGGYTLGCHSLRYLTGGFLNVFSKSPVKKRVYNCVSCLNRGHMLWAWCSLTWVVFTDIYVRMCAMGVWTDLRIL